MSEAERIRKQIASLQWQLDTIEGRNSNDRRDTLIRKYQENEAKRLELADRQLTNRDALKAISIGADTTGSGAR